DGSETELLENVCSGVTVTGAGFREQRNQFQRTLPVDTQLLELRAVLVQRVQEVIARIQARLKAFRDQVERFSRVLRQPTGNQLGRSACAVRDVRAERVRQRERRLCDLLDVRTRHVRDLAEVRPD